MGYYFYIDGLMMPQTPSGITIKTNSKNQVVELINGGEINMLRSPSLKEFSFELTFPMFHYHYLNVTAEQLRKPKEYIEFIENLKSSKKPFQFIISRIKPGGEDLGLDWIYFNTNVTCGIESFTHTENADDGFDVTYSITLREWKQYGTKVVSVLSETDEKVTAKEETQRATTKTADDIPATYTVKQGDTLWAIAKKYFDNGSKYTDIAKLNSISNPNIISVGQVLKLR